MYKMLQTPMKIGKVTIPNRVVMPPMGVTLGSPMGGVSDDIIAYYEARAKGGVGLIITEITRVVDGAGIGSPCQLAARNLSDLPQLQRLAETIHKYGSKIFIQLHHPGRQAPPLMIGGQPVAPSAVPMRGGAMPRELTTEECEDLVQRFAFGAFLAKRAGMDGVEFHGAHDYLICEFLSPAVNKRTDKYGGSFENRLRFLMEIIQRTRHLCGPDFPISVRLSVIESQPGGLDLEQSVKIAQALEAAGVNSLNVSCSLDGGIIEVGSYQPGWKSYMAEAIKKAVNIPIISVNSIKEPGIAEKVLNDGICDFVAVGRGNLADPEWAKKAFSGRADEIIRCVGCMSCFGEVVKARRIKCAFNPCTGREREYANLVANGDGRPVAVIGGGPAGIYAALTLKKRGFAPVIFEKGSRLGGQLNVADKGYAKDKITDTVNALITLVERAGIEVRLNTEATVEAVKELNPCGVIVSVGSTPARPPIPGIDGANVCVAEDVLLGKVNPQGNVVVVGSGMTGLETAEVLAMNGCKVTMVEMQKEVGPGMYPALVNDVMNRMKEHDPVILLKHKLQKITAEGVEVLNLEDEQTSSIKADAVVLAMGVTPREELANTFREAFSNVHVVGDAVKGGRILEATQDGHGRAFVFEA